MVISPIEMNGMISRTNDVISMRHNEDNKAQLDQGNVLSHMETKRTEEAQSVQNASESTQSDTKHDAKEKGKNEFFDIRKKDKKKQEEDEGTVRIKSITRGFNFQV